MAWFDSHCHLDDTAFDPDREQLLKQFKENGVGHLIQVCCEPKNFLRGTEMAKKSEGIFLSYGTHPHEAKFYQPEVEEEMLTLLKGEKAVAVGEIGLDYHYNLSDPEIQKKVFIRQLEWAVPLGKPIIFHVRSAWEDFFSIMSDFEKQIPNRLVHCFTEGPDIAEKCLERGYFFGFGGAVTFKNSHGIREALKLTPPHRFFIETDAPYLSPVPFRGKRNHSGHIPLIGKFIAEFLGNSANEIEGNGEKKDSKEFEDQLFQRTLEFFSICPPQ